MNNSSTFKKGFTLPELIIALAVGVIVLSQFQQFMKGSSLSLYRSSVELNSNQEVRGYLSLMKVDAQEADYALLYENFTSADSTSIKPLSTGDFGNFILFVYNGEDTDIYDNTPAPVLKIVGYYLDRRESENQKIRRFEKFLGNVYVGASIESMLPGADDTTMDAHQIVCESVVNVNERMVFYKIEHRTIMITAKTLNDNDNFRFAKMINSTFRVDGV